MAKIAVFVDGSNMFYAQKKVGYFLDYRKVIDHFSKGNELFKAFFYVGTTSPPAVKDKRFLDYLIYTCQYTVRNKEVKTIFDDATGEQKQKCNLDIEIAVEMFKEIDHYETAILMTGDGDFTSVVELLRSRGKTTEIVAASSMLARELANVARKVHYLDAMQLSLGREDRKFSDRRIECVEIKE